MKPEHNEQKAEVVGGMTVRAMVFTAAILVLAAGAVYLFKFGHTLPNYHTFRPGQTGLRSVHGILRSALALDIRGMIQLGILLLIAIPIFRVAFFALTFIVRRDWLYTGVTLLVFGILAFSLFGKWRG